MIFAHIDGDKKETLKEHSELTYKYAADGLKIIHQIIHKIFDDKEAVFLCEAAEDVIKMHDDGKASPYFQCQKMQNEEFKRDTYSLRSSNHSILSAILFLAKYLSKLDERYEKGTFGLIYPCNVERMIWYFSFIISRHHSSLSDFSIEDFKQKIVTYFSSETYYINTEKTLEEIKREINIDADSGCWNKEDKDIRVYILCRYLYSILCYSDFVATAEFMSGQKLEEKSNFKEISERYNKSKLGMLPREKSECSKINKLRNEIFLEAENTYLKNEKSQMYYLSAPCGSGKTNTLINLMLQCALKENKKRGLFVFPLNALIEQTGTIFNTFVEFEKHYMIKNSVTSMTKKDFDEETDYDTMWFNYQFINYPLVITSHVAFFDILFGTEKADIMCLYQLTNSVIVLDEMQQYDARIWNEMIEMFNAYSELLNIKIIMASATLPRLGTLLNDDKCIELLRKDYSQYPEFKDRVECDYSLLESKNIEYDLESLIEENEEKKILIVFIKKSSAIKFFNRIKEKFNDVEILTGDTSNKKKQEIINCSKKQHMILVSTQAIEAGCDVDFEIGMKDIGIVDADEQVLGRIARNGLYKGKVYFFKKDKITDVYKDARNSYNIVQENIRKLFEEKDFMNIYKMILSDIQKTKNSHADNNINSFKIKCSSLAFYTIADKMKLIDSNAIRIFVLDENDGSEELLEEIKTFLNTDMSYSEKRVKMLYFCEKMNEYTLNVMPQYLKENYKKEEKEPLFGTYIVRPYEDGIFL